MAPARLLGWISAVALALVGVASATWIVRRVPQGDGTEEPPDGVAGHARRDGASRLRSLAGSYYGWAGGIHGEVLHLDLDEQGSFTLYSRPGEMLEEWVFSRGILTAAGDDLSMHETEIEWKDTVLESLPIALERDRLVWPFRWPVYGRPGERRETGPVVLIRSRAGEETDLPGRTCPSGGLLLEAMGWDGPLRRAAGLLDGRAVPYRANCDFDLYSITVAAADRPAAWVVLRTDEQVKRFVTCPDCN